MKHLLLTLSFLLSLLLVKGQNTPIGMSHLKDSSTGTGSGYFKPIDSINRPPAQGIKVPLEARVYSLERRVVYLTRQTIELQRKMDSLLLERRQLAGPFALDSAMLRNIIHGVGTYPTYKLKDTLSLGPFFLY